MNNKPLEYQSLKAVLMHMEANIRFQISNRCPSIRKTEKSVPLHIDQLVFDSQGNGPNRVKVNSTVYSIGTYREYNPDVKVLVSHHQDNEKGGVSCDLDRYGYEDFSSDEILEPGDMNITNVQRRVRIPRFSNDWALHEQALLEYFENLLTDKNHKNDTLSIKRINQLFDQKSAELAPFFCKKDNVPPSYSTLVQLKIESQNGKKNIWRFKGKLYKTEKRLNTFLFENRKIINVRNLDITESTKIIRLPPNLNMKVREIEAVSNPYTIEAIHKFVGDFSYQVNVLKMEELRSYDHSIIAKSKQLQIVFVKAEEFEELAAISNRKVNVELSGFSLQNHINLIQRWKESGREIGTCWTFGIRGRDGMNELRKALAEVFNRNANQIFMNIPLNATSRLILSYEPLPYTYVIGIPKYTLEVVPV